MTNMQPYNEGAANLMALLTAQKKAAEQEGLTPAEVRVDRIRRLESALETNQRRLCAATSADFAGRPEIQTRMEVSATLGSLRHSREHLTSWMKPEERQVPEPMRLVGAKAQVFYQPLGVVGIVSPWNYPLVLSISPLASIFAAGNRAMLKPSELSPETSMLLKEIFEAAFDSTELAVVLGDAQVGQAFTQLPFDHLLFTGAPSVAKHVMRAAAENLVPVTLELGGKCPVIIDQDADMQLAADRVMWGKITNAGQICLAPDYVFVPEGQEEEFIDLARAVIRGWYTSLRDNPQYCSIISPRHFARLNGYIEQARSQGTRVIELGFDENFAGQAGRRIPPTIVVEPADNLTIMQDEVFGPLLSLKTYSNLDQVINFINARPRPLALYYFGNNKQSIRNLKERTVSGGMTVNDIAMHAGLETLPLGGVGNSGMGAYHGRDGFLRFSHAKAVLEQEGVSLARIFNPPYTGTHSAILDNSIGTPMT